MSKFWQYHAKFDCNERNIFLTCHVPEVFAAKDAKVHLDLSSCDFSQKNCENALVKAICFYDESRFIEDIRKFLVCKSFSHELKYMFKVSSIVYYIPFGFFPSHHFHYKFGHSGKQLVEICAMSEICNPTPPLSAEALKHQKREQLRV